MIRGPVSHHQDGVIPFITFSCYFLASFELVKSLLTCREFVEIVRSVEPILGK